MDEYVYSWMKMSAHDVMIHIIKIKVYKLDEIQLKKYTIQNVWHEI